MVPITQLTAAELITLIQARDLSPVEVTDAFLNRILDSRTSSNAFVDVYENGARAAALHACKSIRSGQSTGPLQGIPIALKDLFHVQGEHTAAGSACWTHRRAHANSAVVERLLNKGMVILGKTHTVEFGLGAFGINEHFATPRNPWSNTIELAPGGSSSGSAVAVAAGLTPWALGTDTGGSVRIPAAWCGVVGFKPSHGKIDMNNVVPLSPTLDSVGILARTVNDASILYSHLLDDSALQSFKKSTRQFEQITLNQYYVATMPLNERAFTHEHVLEHYHRAIAELQSLGIHTQISVFPIALEECLRKNSLITFYEAYANYGALFQDANSNLGKSVRARIARGAKISRKTYLDAREEMSVLRLLFDDLFNDADAIVLPTTQMLPCSLDEVDQVSPPNHFTRFVNFLDLCAVAVPAGFTEDGRPFSLQFVCKREQEHIALHLARAYEVKTHWRTKKPPVFQLSIDT